MGGGSKGNFFFTVDLFGQAQQMRWVYKHEIAILMTYTNITMVDIHKKNRHTVFWIPLPSLTELGCNDAHVCTYVNI